MLTSEEHYQVIQSAVDAFSAVMLAELVQNRQECLLKAYVTAYGDDLVVLDMENTGWFKQTTDFAFEYNKNEYLLKQNHSLVNFALKNSGLSIQVETVEESIVFAEPYVKPVITVNSEAAKAVEAAIESCSAVSSFVTALTKTIEETWGIVGGFTTLQQVDAAFPQLSYLYPNQTRARVDQSIAEGVYLAPNADRLARELNLKITNKEAA